MVTATMVYPESMDELARKDGRRLRIYTRPAVTLNRNQIARDSGINRRHIGRVMAGQERPRLDTAHRIAVAMGVSLDQLYSLLSPLWTAKPEDAG